MDLLQEKEIVHPIQLIPEEIRGKIFNKIPQKEALNLQLVCRQWNKDMKNYYNFSIKLDERSPHFHEILQVRINKLKIIKLIQPQINTDPQNHGGLFFKYPELIKELNICDVGTGENNHTISAENLAKLLQNYGKSLRNLEICLTSYAPALTDPYSPNITYDFQNLKVLWINIGKYHLSDSLNIWTASPITAIADSQLPNLSSLKVQFTDVTEKPDFLSYTLFMFKLLTKTSKKLDELSCGFGHSGELSTLSDSVNQLQLKLASQDLEIWNKMSSLKTISLDFPTKNLQGISQELDLWLNLILNQKKLQKFVLSNGNVNGLPLPLELFESLVLNNYETIEEIDVQDLKVNSGSLIDLSLFESCHKLKSLFLGRKEDEAGADLRRVSLDLVNLAALPQSMSNLVLKRFNILSKDILNLLNSDCVNHLEHLSLFNCGVRGELGITSDILKKIETLGTTTLEGICVEGLNSADPEEKLKFKEMFLRLGLRHGNYFDEFFIGFYRDDVGVYLIRYSLTPSMGKINVNLR